MPLFDVRKKEVYISLNGETVKEIKDLRTKYYKNKDKLFQIVEYVYKVYDKNSPFFKMHLSDRKKDVSLDMFGKHNGYEKVEAIPEVLNLIIRFNILQFDIDEAYIESTKRQIEKYMELYENFDLTVDNHEDFRKIVLGARDLLNLKKQLEKISLEAKTEKNVGGGVAALFEDDNE